MNVSLQNIDKVSALLTVKLEKADYQEKSRQIIEELPSEGTDSRFP